MKALGKRSIASFLKVWLDVLWWLLWVAGAGLVLVLVYTLVTGNPVDQFVDVPVVFDLDASAYDITSDAVGVSGAKIDDANGMLKFNSPSSLLMLVYLCIAAAYGLVMLVVVYQLRKIFRSLAAGRLFNLETAARIRVIGLFAIFGELAVTLLNYACQLYVRSNFDASGLTLGADIDIDLSSIFGGFVLLILAEAFRIGATLQEDRDLTV